MLSKMVQHKRKVFLSALNMHFNLRAMIGENFINFILAHTIFTDLGIAEIREAQIQQMYARKNFQLL